VGTDTDRNFIERMIWDEVARHIANGAAAILPVGAAAKEHGYRQAAERLAEQSHGSHADELETSLMLALAPHLVDMARAEPSPAIGLEAPGPLTPLDLNSPNYSRSGSYGDPTLATLEKGEILLAAMLDDLREQVAAFIADGAAVNQRSGAARSVSR
jgi:creatinine amidohydrolase